MAARTRRPPEASDAAHRDVGTRCFFDQINSPGCYVSKQTGALFRIPEDGLTAGRSPSIGAVSNDPWVVTKISGDPYLPRTKARTLAADLDLEAKF